MRDRLVFFRRVALEADAVARQLQFRRMRIVAVGAGDALREHLALLERTVIVDLILHLPIGEIEPMRQRRDDMGVGKPIAGNPVLRNLAAARVAEAAGLDLLAKRRGRIVARHVSCRRIRRPADVRALVEIDQEPLRVAFARTGPRRALMRMRPSNVLGPLPVASLAADADLLPRRREGVVGRVVILAHAGRVTLGAHEIPVLVELRPMQNVGVADRLARIEMEPALTALLLRPAVPRDGERLNPPVRKRDQILLQRIEAEGVFDLVFRKLAVRAVRLDIEFSVPLIESGLDAEMLEARIVEVA